MKNLTSLCLMGILSISISYAQQRADRQNRSPEELTKMQVERLTEQLQLTKAQQDSVSKYVLLTNKDQIKLLETTGENTKGEAFEKMRTQRKELDTKIRSFLTAEQIKSYDEQLKNRPQRGNRRPA